jgi:hypothetical protein
MIAWNDRRKAKKAASDTTKAQISAMAKRGTLRATTTSPGQREFGKAERAAVHEEVRNNTSDWSPRATRYSMAARKVEGAADVKGFDGPGYRHLSDTSNKRGIQKKSYLPKKAK